MHNLEKWTRRLAALGEGRFPLGSVDWLITDAIAFNNHEKIRVGLGLATIGSCLISLN